MMSEGFVGRDAFSKVAGHVRFTTVEVPQIGTVRLRSISALDYAGIEALTVKAAMAARGSTGNKQVKALAEAGVELIRLCAVDEKGNPIFSAEDKPMLLNMDSSITQSIASAAMEHCGIDGADLETIAKNSAATSEDNLPSA